MSIITHVTKGSIFDDPELFNPLESEILKTKSLLLRHLRKHIKANKLNQGDIMNIFDLSEERAERLLAFSITAFSIDELVLFLEKCSLHVILHSEIIGV
jgi:predicted XRE-type DNA-binding protein